MKYNPQFPLYIPSKSRADTRYTAKYLDYMKVPYRLVIEPQQYKMYLDEVKDKNKLLVLDMSYKEKYEVLDEHGLTKSTGPGPARNFIWDHSISKGFEWHWVMDDNIRSFFRLHKNKRIKVSDGSIFKAMEDFCLRYKNISMAGPNYSMFVPCKFKRPAFICNTRIYSCNFIRNDVPFRWRGRYNEDTILSLDMLKAGWCTVQFNAFLQNKICTQIVAGGNSEEFYFKEGTRAKSEMQAKVHPDVSKVVMKYGRVHHHVNYSVFKRNKLIYKDDYQPVGKSNNYGMKLRKKDERDG